MLTTGIHFALGEESCCYSEETGKKMMGTFAALEIILTLGALVVGYLMRSNSFPSALSFLNGRMQLGSALMITGISALALNAIFGTMMCAKILVT